MKTQIDEIIDDLHFLKRKGKKVFFYWIKVTEKVLLALCLPIWIIPYMMHRGRKK